MSACRTLEYNTTFITPNVKKAKLQARCETTWLGFAIFKLRIIRDAINRARAKLITRLFLKKLTLWAIRDTSAWNIFRSRTAMLHLPGLKSLASNADVSGKK